MTPLGSRRLAEGDANVYQAWVTSDAFEVVRLFVSTGHNFVGHHGREPSEHPMAEVSSVRCLAGRGLEGDRFLDHKPGYLGQVTFFSEEVFLGLCRSLDRHDRPPSVLRRNVITRGADLDTLIGQDFLVQGVRFLGKEECRPCHWMDRAFGAGAEAWLKGRGGLRAQILTDGCLRVP